MSHTVLEPSEIDSGERLGRWTTIIYNNDVNSVDEVVLILMEATGCDVQEAATETWEAHHFGKAPVHFAGRPECERVAGVISSIGVRTEVAPEWRD